MYKYLHSRYRDLSVPECAVQYPCNTNTFRSRPIMNPSEQVELSAAATTGPEFPLLFCY